MAEVITKLDALLVYVEVSPYTWTLERRRQLGLYYVAQHAVDHGFRVKVDNVSSNDDVVPRLVRLLREGECPILGLYVDHDNLWELRRVIAAVKAELPSVELVLGGPQATAAPELVHDHVPQALCCVIGEGEETFLALLRMPARDTKALIECPGLTVAAESGIIHTPPRPAIECLDRLSIPRRTELSIDPDEKHPSSILTGRGCTGRCAFCFEGGRPRSSGRKLRVHSVERCLEEIEYLVREFQPRYITIMDDTFVADVSRLREFCRAMIQRYHGELKWFCEARVDTLFRQKDLLPLMVEAGLLRMQIGGESGSQRVLDAYRKGITVDQLRSIARAAREHGLISLYANFIIGGAFESRETFLETRDLAVELLHLAPGILGVGYSFFTPYPGTPMYESPAEYGLQMTDADVVTAFGDAHVFCRTEGLTRFEILQLGEEFDSAVDEAMGELCQTLPFEMIERIFEAYHCWDLSTEWHDRLCRSQPLFNYFQSLHEGRARRMASFDDSELEEQVPFRVVDLKASSKDGFLVRTPMGATLQLDPLDSMLLELAGGKLSLDEITGVVAESLADLAPAEVRAAVLERYRALDEQRLVVWREPARAVFTSPVSSA